MIGFFDSGVGGLTVLRDVYKRLPQYSAVYLGDSLRAPYGTKTHDEITEYTWQGVEWLFKKG
ncbi:glutamate racemase, partial [Patescibacteria group bacterium]|nr:glutamate racemase [Patescibacteria group bacterium]